MAASDFENALFGLISGIQGFQEGRAQKSQFEERAASRRISEARLTAEERSSRIKELETLGGATLEDIEAGRDLAGLPAFEEPEKGGIAVGAIPSPLERRQVGAFRSFQERAEARATTSFFDPVTGKFTTGPRGAKVARGAAPERGLSAGVIERRLKTLEGKIRLTPEDREEIATLQAEFRRRLKAGSQERPDIEPPTAVNPADPFNIGLQKPDSGFFRRAVNRIRGMVP